MPLYHNLWVSSINSSTPTLPIIPLLCTWLVPVAVPMAAGRPLEAQRVKDQAEKVLLVELKLWGGQIGGGSVRRTGLGRREGRQVKGRGHGVRWTGLGGGFSVRWTGLGRRVWCEMDRSGEEGLV